MKTRINSFLADQSGAVTVDWVVLTAAVVGLGIATVGAVRTGVLSLGDDVEQTLTDASVASLGELGASVAAWLFTPRVYDQSILDANMDALRAWSDADLLSNAATYAGLSAVRMDQGNAYDAASFMDSVYMLDAVMRERDLPWPDDVATLQELDTRYVELFES